MPRHVSTRASRPGDRHRCPRHGLSLIGGVALVLEAGNAYAHQRQAQNGADAIANAGATVLAERISAAR